MPTDLYQLILHELVFRGGSDLPLNIIHHFEAMGFPRRAIQSCIWKGFDNGDIVLRQDLQIEHKGGRYEESKPV
jgi:hypothetical protein